MRRRTLIHAPASFAASAAGAWLLAGCGKRRTTTGKARPVAPGASVLALGDSLTHGTGAADESSYPAVLAALTGWTVVNAGVPGDTSEQAARRLPELLQLQAPQLVLLSIGGNDLLRRMPEAQTESTIEGIGRAVLASGAQLLLIAVPRPTLAARLAGHLQDHPMYEALATRLQVPLHAGGWSAVLADAALRSDEIHANAAGYRRFAEGLAATAREVGLLA